MCIIYSIYTLYIFMYIYTEIERREKETQLSRFNLLCELYFYKVQESSICDILSLFLAKPPVHF